AAGSVHGAADALQRTQSSVTKRIQMLEWRGGGWLLKRGRFGVRSFELGRTIISRPSARSRRQTSSHTWSTPPSCGEHRPAVERQPPDRGVPAPAVLLLGWLRHRFFSTSFLRSFVSVTLGGAIIASLGAALGVLAAG